MFIHTEMLCTFITIAWAAKSSDNAANAKYSILHLQSTIYERVLKLFGILISDLFRFIKSSTNLFCKLKKFLPVLSFLSSMMKYIIHRVIS
jgi:hypothetical protein